jgi:hypothetical protein
MAQDTSAPEGVECYECVKPLAVRPVQVNDVLLKEMLVQ